MMLRITSPREFWAGMIYVLLGSCAMVMAQDYQMGSATRMGPGYFPAVLGGLLVGIGLIALGRGIKVKGPRIEPIALRPLVITVCATLLFAAIVRGLGLALALPLYVLLTASASRKFRLLPTLILAVLLTLFCCVVFIGGLGVPLPLVGPWVSLLWGDTGS